MSKLKPAIHPIDHVKGDLRAPIHLVEFGDYECPFCARAFVVVDALEEALGSRFCFAFRNFPLVNAHPHALSAAEAAEAAGAQGKFWEMHDVLYRNQDSLEPADLLEHAALVDLDLRRFVRDLRGNQYADRIRADMHSGAISGVRGTPTFFINGYRHDGSYRFDELYEAITSRLGADLVG